MPDRKLVQIGQDPQLPTVAEYFRDLAARQGDDIRLLKERAAARQVQPKHRQSVEAESWRLHPVVPTAGASPARSRAKTKKRAPARPKRRPR